MPAAGAPAEPEIHLRLDQPLPDAVDTLEQTLVRRALERSHGRVEEAARILGISRKGLFLKRRRWGCGRHLRQTTRGSRSERHGWLLEERNAKREQRPDVRRGS